MKNGRKILSIILTICMVMQILPVFAANAVSASGAGEINYIINDDFESPEDTANWTHIAVTDKAYEGGVKQTTLTEDGESLGVLELTTGTTANSTGNGQQAGAVKELGENAITLSEGKQVIIKTKVKHTSDSARFYFKANRPNKTTFPHAEVNNLYTLFNVIRDQGLSYIDGSTSSNQGNAVSVKDADGNQATTSLANQWIEAEMVMSLKDGKNLVDYTFKTGGNTYYASGKFTQPTAVYTDKYGEESTATAFSTLDTLSFTFREAADTLYVDYVKVYEVYTVDTIANESYTADGDITVTLDTEVGNAAFADAIALYDGETLVETVNTIDELGKVVTMSHSGLDRTKTYTIKLDESKLPAKYTSVAEDKSFFISDVSYIVYDEFAENDTEDWERILYSATGASTTFGASEITDDLGNYALKMTSPSDPVGLEVYFSKKLKNPIVFEDGKNVVIETKFMQSGGSASDGRAFLKFNMPAAYDATNEVNGYYGTLLYMQDDKMYVPAAAWGTSNAMATYTVASSDVNNTWFNVKVIINGDSKTTSYEITDAVGNKYETPETCDINHPDNENFAEDVLNSIDFRLRKTNEFYVDYVKVYQQYTIDTFVNESYTADGDVTVTLDTEVGNAAFADAVALYDGETLVTTNNTIDESGKVVTMSHSGLDSTKTYTVKLDKTKLPAAYTSVAEDKTFFVDDISYIVYDEFADGDTEDWEKITYSATGASTTFGASDEKTESGNYALKMTSPRDAVGLEAYFSKKLKNPIVFEDGKNVVIETKFMQTGGSSNDGRAFLKFNMPAAYDATNEVNGYYGTLLYMQDDKMYVPAAAWGTSNAMATYTVASSDVNNTWFNVKVIINGDSKTTSYEITDAAGNKYETPETCDINHPDNENFAEDALNSIDFRLRKTNEFYVDYVRVYEQYGIELYANDTYKYDEPVSVSFSEANDALLNATDLYSGEEVVTSTKALSDDGKTITFTVDGGLKNGAGYSVKVNTSLLDPQYYMSDNVADFTAADMTYVVYDDFGDLAKAPSKEEWNLIDGYATTTADGVYDETLGGYFLKYAATAKDGGKLGDGTTTLDDKTHVLRKLPFGGIKYENGKNVVIETRYMQTSATARSYLKANINTEVFNQLGWNLQTLNGNNKGRIFYASGVSGTQTYAPFFDEPFNVEGTYVNKFVTVKTTVLGASGRAEVTVTDDNGNSKTVTASMSQPENAGTVTDALNTLAFNFRDCPNTLYVDYVKVYEVELNGAQAVLENGRYFEAGSPVDVKIITETDISDVNKDAFAVANSAGEAAEFTVSVDNDAKVVSVNITNAQAEEKYTISIDKLEMSKYGIDYIGTETFYVEAREERLTTKISDTFDNDTVADGRTSSDWYLGTVADEAAKGALDIVEIEGATGKALKVTGKVTDGNGIDNGYQTVLTKKLGGGIEYTDGNRVVIKTRVMHTNNGARFMLAENRPDSLVLPDNTVGWNLYNLFTVNQTSGLEYYSGIAYDGNQGSMSKMILGDLANKWIDLTIVIDGYNQKMNLTAKVDDEKYPDTYSVTGLSTARSKSVWETHYGIGTSKTAFDALERLSFTFRGKNDDLYIDYIEVYEAAGVVNTAVDAVKMKGNADIGAYITASKDGLDNDLSKYVDLYNGEALVEITKTVDEETGKVVLNPTSDLAAGTYTVKFDREAIEELDFALAGKAEYDVEVTDGADVDMDFEGLTAGAFTDESWAFDTSSVTKTADIVTEGNNNFLRITANGETNQAAANLVLTYSKTLDTPFVRDMKASTVFEMKMRTNSLKLRKLVKFNNPDEGNIDTNAYNEVAMNTRVAAAMSKGNIGVAYEDFRTEANPALHKQGNVQNIASYEVNKWYTIKTIYHNAEGTASTYVYDGDTLIGSVEDKELSAWWFNFYDHNKTQPQVMHTIDDITIRFRPEGSATVTNEQFDIDDIKLYNIVEENVKAAITIDGKEVETLKPDKTVKPVFTLHPAGATETTYKVISAMYVDGKFTDMHIDTVTTTGTVYTDAVGYTTGADATNVMIKAFVWSGDNNMIPLCEAATAYPDVYRIYVQTYENGGRDSANGEETSPVATLEKAVELANAAKANGYPKSEVIVGDGNYELTGKSIRIDENLDADALTIRAENKGKAKFINGVAYKLSDAEPAPDDIKNRLAVESARANLMQINLFSDSTVAAKGIPQLNLPGTYSYFVMQSDGGNVDGNGNQLVNITEPTTTPNELFFNGNAMTLARYPDVDAANPYEIIGTVSTTDSSADNYYNTNSVTRNWMDDKKDNAVYIPAANRVAEGAKITLARATKWSQAENPMAFGFWAHDWATQSMPVTVSGSTFTTDYPSHYGLAEGQRYYVYNLLEEISQPGEYYIDRENGIMYFLMPDGATEDDEIVMSLYGSDDSGIINILADNVTVDGLVFTASRGIAVKTSGDNVVIKNCEISGTGEFAVSVDGTNSTVQNCVIKDVNGGINLNGGSTNTLTRGENKALNNTITNFSRLDKTYTGAIELGGMGNLAEGNTIAHGEHLAMRILGVQNTIRNNDISYVLKEADDMGAIYTGRSWVMRDNVIEYNYIHDLHSTEVGEGDSKIGGIFLDDHFADVTIRGNIFKNIGGNGIRLNAGREHTIENNIFLDIDGHPVVGSEAKGNESNYSAEHIPGVNALLTNEVWLNSEYASEVFNAEKTAYNPDLLFTRGLVYKNNVACGCQYNYAYFEDTANDNGTVDVGNQVLDNAPTKSAISGLGIIDASVFNLIPFSKAGIN